MQISPAIVAVVLSIIGTIVLSFWGWLAVQVVRQWKSIADLQNRIANQESTCSERLDWLRNMDNKLGQTSENVQRLVGYLLPKDKQNETTTGGEIK